MTVSMRRWILYTNLTF